jgi:lipid-A-disaccharide synthase
MVTFMPSLFSKLQNMQGNSPAPNQTSTNCSSNYDLFLFAGERSGDLYGGKLLKALHDRIPSLQIFGVGGETMRKQRFTCFLPMEEFQVMGFIDVFFSLPKLIKLFNAIVRTILEQKPQTVILIDYPGFNLRLAKALKKRGYQGQIFHYICPSVWAWGQKRIPAMASCLDKLLTILPFERAYFKNTSLSVDYVGHPLQAILTQHPYQSMETPKGKRVIAIFPGSREKELKRNLPLLLLAAKQLQQLEKNLYFIISCSNPSFYDFLRNAITKQGLHEEEFCIVDGTKSYDLMQISHLALAKSGTIALELALHKVPTVVVYGITKIDLFIARDLLRIRLPYYSLPNILCQKEVFPELIGPNFTLDRLVSKALIFLRDDHARLQCEQDCHRIEQLLGKDDAHQEAAKIIANTLFDQNKAQSTNHVTI